MLEKRTRTNRERGESYREGGRVKEIRVAEAVSIAAAVAAISFDGERKGNNDKEAERERD